jgi:short-subunit dehydrogenase
VPVTIRALMDLRGRTVLLTGATGGLGQAIARELARRGASLIVTGRRADVLEPLAGEIGGRPIECDLGEAAAVERLLDAVGTGVDVLVANAGLPGSGHISSFSAEDIDRAVAVNLRAPMVMAARLSQPMVARGAGHLLFVSSLSGRTASGGGSVYSATKFGLRGFAHALREDLRDSGVGVSVVLPGFISDSGMFHESGTQLPRFVGTRTPQDVATAVAGAIEHDRAEVGVAPLSMRAGAAFGSLAPELSARIQRRLGGAKIAEDMARGQQGKRR